MSSVGAPLGQPHKQLIPAEHAALIAALATGKSQTQVAKDFGLHRNTVSRLARKVKQIEHVSNPLSKSYKDRLKPKAYGAVERGLDSKRDPYKAATVGLRFLEGSGELTAGGNVQVDVNIPITFSWGATQEPEYESERDVTPAQVAESASKDPSAT